MEDDKSGLQEAIACPICQRPLRRTNGHLLSALECEQCGPFSDFTGGSTRSRGTGSNQGRGGSGSEPPK
jgi:hypothetical protein